MSFNYRGIYGERQILKRRRDKCINKMIETNDKIVVIILMDNVLEFSFI